MNCFMHRGGGKNWGYLFFCISALKNLEKNKSKNQKSKVNLLRPQKPQESLVLPQGVNYLADGQKIHIREKKKK